MDALGHAVLSEFKRVYRQYKKLAEDAMVQLTDEQLHFAENSDSNSVALIVKHMAGNMRSRWTDFLTSDGEKPDRNRDSEFESTGNETRAEVMRWWENGWNVLFETLDALEPEDLERTIVIRGEHMPALQALSRQVAHYAYHVGQIVYIGKIVRGAEWKTLSIAKNKSKDYNEKLKFG